MITEMIKPLTDGTQIDAYASTDGKKEEYSYVIKKLIAKGSSSIVYEANRTWKKEAIALKQYITDSVKNYDLANKEFENGLACSNYGEYGFLLNHVTKIENATDICLLNDQTEDISSDEKLNACNYKIFGEMEYFSNMCQLTSLLPTLKEEYNSKDTNQFRKNYIKYLLNKNQSYYSAYGILKIIKAILFSVEIIHNNNYVHRDIKPENMLFERSSDSYFGGVVSFIDYGSALPLIDDVLPPHASLKSSGDVTGSTPGYIPPETIHGYEIENYEYRGWTVQSDIYQIGCIMYYLFCNSFPPEEKKPCYNKAKLDRVLDSYDLEKEDKELIEGIIYKAVNQNPNLRYENTDSFSKDIQKMLERTGPSKKAIEDYRKYTEGNITDYSEVYDRIFSLLNKINDNLSEYDWVIQKRADGRSKTDILSFKNKFVNYASDYYGAGNFTIDPKELAFFGFNAYSVCRISDGIQLVREVLKLDIKDTKKKVSIYFILYDLLRRDENVSDNNEEIQFIFNRVEELMAYCEDEKDLLHFYIKRFGWYHYAINEEQLSLKDFDMVTKYIHRLNDYKTDSWQQQQFQQFLYRKAYLHHEKKQYIKAIPILKEQLAFMDEVLPDMSDSRDRDDYAGCYSLLAYCYSKINDSLNACIYCKKALDLLLQQCNEIHKNEYFQNFKSMLYVGNENINQITDPTLRNDLSIALAKAQRIIDAC